MRGAFEAGGQREEDASPAAHAARALLESGGMNLDARPTSPTEARLYPRSRELYARALRVIPGGIHLTGRPLLHPDESPLYFDQGRGATIRDVDGNQYTDFFMAFGPHILGYAHPEVDAAACTQLRDGGLLSMNHPLHVRFAERLVSRFPSAEMAVFFKTGSEATTAALRIARRATGRTKVIRSGYHGWHDWCLPLEDFVPKGLREEVPEFDPNEPGDLGRVLCENEGSVAAVILAPEMLRALTRETLISLMETTRAHGALFILDEVKTAFRALSGSIQQRFGLAPDMTTLSKALGNGWPIAAIVGKRDVMNKAAGMHYSATFHGETPSMAAALRTLEILEREPVTEHMDALGRRLIAGLNEQSTAHSIEGHAYAEPIPAMPFYKITCGDPEMRARATDAFFAHVLSQGFLLHPRHLWFISYAHTERDIDRLLDVTNVAFRHAANAAGRL